jgi:hypothetical protein
MSSIRPLATITILAVVGVILYVKINEGPAHVASPVGQAWQNQPPIGVPALDTTVGNQSSLFPSAPPTTSAPAPGGVAPAWTGGAASDGAGPPSSGWGRAEGETPAISPTVGSLPSTTAAPAAQNDALNLPPVPDIPNVPPLQADDSPSAAPPVTSLPADIPTAQYSGAAAQPGAPASQGTISGRVPSLGTATPDMAATVTPPVASTSATPPATAPTRAGGPPDCGCRGTASGRDRHASVEPAGDQRLAKRHGRRPVWFGAAGQHRGLVHH